MEPYINSSVRCYCCSCLSSICWWVMFCCFWLVPTESIHF